MSVFDLWCYCEQNAIEIAVSSSKGTNIKKNVLKLFENTQIEILEE